MDAVACELVSRLEFLFALRSSNGSSVQQASSELGRCAKCRGADFGFESASRYFGFVVEIDVETVEQAR